MRLVIQRVRHASVSVDQKVIGAIEQGYLVLIGIGQDDTEKMADAFAQKLFKLRIFEDENGKTNRSISDVGGRLLVVSQFTLYADCRHGNRPGFTDAAAPAEANRLYEYFLDRCREQFGEVEHGSFGADMKVDLENDGPFTLVWDSRDWF